MRNAPTLADDPPSDLGRAELDRAFALLGHPQRLYLYVYLRCQPADEVSLDHLVSRLTRWERSLGATRTSRDDVTVALVHNHLPKLADAGVIDYDREADRVRWEGGVAGLEGIAAVVSDAQRAAERSERPSN